MIESEYEDNRYLKEFTAELVKIRKQIKELDREMSTNQSIIHQNRNDLSLYCDTILENIEAILLFINWSEPQRRPKDIFLMARAMGNIPSNGWKRKITS